MWSDLGSCIFAVSGIGNVRVLPPRSLTRVPDRMVLGKRKSAVAQERRERQIVISREFGCDLRPGARDRDATKGQKSWGSSEVHGPAAVLASAIVNENI